MTINLDLATLEELAAKYDDPIFPKVYLFNIEDLQAFAADILATFGRGPENLVSEPVKVEPAINMFLMQAPDMSECTIHCGEEVFHYKLFKIEKKPK